MDIDVEKKIKELSDKTEFAHLLFNNLSMVNTYPLTMEERARLDIRYQKARSDYFKYLDELKILIISSELGVNLSD